MPRKKKKRGPGRPKGKSKPRNPPKDGERCTYQITATRRCKNAKVKGRQYCNMHPPGRARKIGAKGNAVKSERKRQAEEAKARWAIKSFGDIQGHVLIALEKLEKEEKEKKLSQNQWWAHYTNLLRLVIECHAKKAKYEGGGGRVAVFILQGSDGTTMWAEPKSERPEPEVMDSEVEFRPPNITEKMNG